MQRSDFFNGVTADFLDLGKTNILDRWNRHLEWWDGRLSLQVDPYSKYTASRISTTIEAHDRGGRKISGINFASQDYLSLASHPLIAEAACATIRDLGVHSAGSMALMGNTAISIRLEQAIADFLGMRDCILFPIGWAAGYGIVKTLVTRRDHIIIDVLAHACLQEGARNATGNVHAVPHLSTAAVERRLKRLRAAEPQAGILVVTETLFSMDSDVPDIRSLQALCHQYDATLVVDVAHDLGSFGATGRGHLEIQGMLGKVDIVMGSFSKSFASNGGFVATNHPALKMALRYACGPLTFTNALSPIQAAIVLAAISIITSPEGSARRERLMANILRMRNGLQAEGFTVLGQPSAIVPVVIGPNDLSRLITRHAQTHGAVVNLVEYPAVSRNTCRWRIQVMADHTPEQIDRFIQIAVDARANAERDVEEIRAVDSLAAQ
jgi:glycine C-acetyltransferase